MAYYHLSSTCEKELGKILKRLSVPNVPPWTRDASLHPKPLFLNLPVPSLFQLRICDCLSKTLKKYHISHIESILPKLPRFNSSGKCRASGMGYWNSSDDEAPTSYSQADLSIQKKFSECLDEVHRQHPSVVFGTRCNPVNPGLHVDGFGTLGLPLSDQDAASLTHATERLMSGDAGDLATSNCTRNIPANQIGLRNLVWSDFANAIFKDVLKEFGLDPESSHITAELARLTIQRKSSRRPSEFVFIPFKLSPSNAV